MKINRLTEFTGSTGGAVDNKAVLTACSCIFGTISAVAGASAIIQSCASAPLSGPVAALGGSALTIAAQWLRKPQ